MKKAEKAKFQVGDLIQFERETFMISNGVIALIVGIKKAIGPGGDCLICEVLVQNSSRTTSIFDYSALHDVAILRQRNAI